MVFVSLCNLFLPEISFENILSKIYDIHELNLLILSRPDKFIPLGVWVDIFTSRVRVGNLPGFSEFKVVFDGG